MLARLSLYVGDKWARGDWLIIPRAYREFYYRPAWAHHGPRTSLQRLTWAITIRNVECVWMDRTPCHLWDFNKVDEWAANELRLMFTMMGVEQLSIQSKQVSLCSTLESVTGVWKAGVSHTVPKLKPFVFNINTELKSIVSSVLIGHNHVCTSSGCAAPYTSLVRRPLLTREKRPGTHRLPAHACTCARLSVNLLENCPYTVT